MKNCSNFMIYIELLQHVGGADGTLTYTIGKSHKNTIYW